MVVVKPTTIRIQVANAGARNLTPSRLNTPQIFRGQIITHNLPSSIQNNPAIYVYSKWSPRYDPYISSRYKQNTILQTLFIFIFSIYENSTVRDNL